MEKMTNNEQQQFEKATKKVKAMAGFYRHLMVYILVNFFLLTLKYFRLDPGEKFLEFSTFSTAFFWGIGVAFHAMSVFGSSLFLGRNWEEKKIQQILNKDNKGQKWE